MKALLICILVIMLIYLILSNIGVNLSDTVWQNKETGEKILIISHTDNISVIYKRADDDFYRVITIGDLIKQYKYIGLYEE